MTALGNRSSQLAPLRSDGVSLGELAKASAPRQVDETHRFWVSGRRNIGSDRREVMEVSFGAPRLVNHLSFRVSRFPLNLQVQYRDANGDWQAVTYAKTSRRRKKRARPREVRKQPVRLSISESVPAKVDSAQAKNHPQHFGKSHWLSESWRVMPIRTSKIRFVFTRNPHGTAPRNHRGQRVPYSVALRNLAIGYRVTTPDDVPRTEEPWWASSKDILGSRVVYSTYTQPATKAVDGSRDTYWRSEPQPFPFAVVNMFLDVRAADGTTSVVDRFWVDPITTGVMCNLYHSDSEPEGDFEGEDSPIPIQFRTEVGSPTLVRDAETQRPYAINLGPDVQAGVEISTVATRIHYSQPWWVGVDARSLVDPASATSHPLVSVGSTQIVQDGTDLKVVCLNGQEVVVPLPDGLHQLNSRFTLVVAYHPYDEASRRDSHFRVSYTLEGGYDPIVVEQAVSPLVDSSAPIRIGLHPSPANTDVSAFSIHGLVVKSETLTEEAEDWFRDEGPLFVLDSESVHEDRGTNYNARIRMHPAFLTDANLFGVVGGSGNRFDEMEWTPVLRDYTLKQGYMHVPPTKAGYWKFEMTGLLPQVYENFLTIAREVQVFPPEVVAAHQAASGEADEGSAPPGVNAAGGMAQSVAYSDALGALKRSPAPSDATQVLVVRDPQQAAQVAETGWIWTYQPWHIGSSAPQFMGARQHHYESLLVNHTTKVAFFAGIREIQPFRVDYTFDDDTPEYVEHFLDTQFLDLDLTTGVEHFEGGVRTISSNAEITSKALMSYRTVRGVQFASQETDAVQVLTDPDLVDEDRFWAKYGDAAPNWRSPGDVLVQRGWFLNTYGDLEEKYNDIGGYGAMDGVLYSSLEGNNQSSGYAEGGIVSEPYTPSGAGEVLGIVKVSAEGDLGAPITVDLISAYDGRTVASTSRWIQSGETAEIEVSYAPGGLVERRTYGEIETLVGTPTTYGELESFKHYELETETGINTDLYLRVRQRGQTDDTFHVHRMGLYDAAVAWFFSNDDGATWWQAVKVRNDPHGVLIFPEPDDPEAPGVGRTLRWKAKVFRSDAAINALHIRPWYGSRARTVERAHGLDSLGPNRSLRDVQPATHQHPMWQQRFTPIEHEYTPLPDPPLFWRNLVPNPGNEGPYDQWTPTGGTVDVQHSFEEG